VIHPGDVFLFLSVADQGWSLFFEDGQRGSALKTEINGVNAS
jgi:hypothetical protein